MGAPVSALRWGTLEAVENTLPFLDAAEGISLSESVLTLKPKPKPDAISTHSMDKMTFYHRSCAIPIGGQYCLG